VTSGSRHPHPSPPARARTLLALNVIRLRRRLGWSQDALAAAAGLHRTFVAHVEREARNVAVDNIERLASALGVQTYELLKPVRQAHAS
jgi:transcriptional regulator with XRE-family HTH domain